MFLLQMFRILKETFFYFYKDNLPTSLWMVKSRLNYLANMHCRNLVAVIKCIECLISAVVVPFLSFTFYAYLLNIRYTTHIISKSRDSSWACAGICPNHFTILHNIALFYYFGRFQCYGQI